ncbi:MAG: type I methionyl aminopeptidase [Desulfarculaceae bacterium]|nr:type I methionyl aminopeptidase [Desulfarculaceae bacterium]MCF8071411.1 type I methionyl aminopeptidase [Desulfarculaceae bacterium]MCF8101736.1 type I methionyl aminopeptidase [Desulfarculaceae bacterium]MCF8117999.1 type I methionyl aminopeptidase [Desulfarculaceae bacterium]
MIVLKTPAEIEAMARANQVVARVLAAARAEVKPGVRTIDLDAMAEDMARQAGAKPSFKGYHGYPYSLCCSVNSEVVHGFPRSDPLKEGDILSMDFGVVLDGFNGDSATTVGVGRVSPEAQALMDATESSLRAGIEQMRPGMRLGDVSAAVQKVAETAGYSVVRQFVGHGIGRALHEDPQVPNFGPPGRGIELKPGLVLAIEPMVNSGGYEVKILADGWTAVTADGKLSAHFEHTVAVTENGPRILSLLPKSGD